MKEQLRHLLVSTNVARATSVRDSKDPEGPRLALGRVELAEFPSDVKAGRYEP